MLRIGLTGGIGCGKTTVARLFSEQFGIPVLDADDLTRKLTAPGQPALAALVSRYGNTLLLEDGQLDRRRLRDIIFSDAVEKSAVEAILHPLVAREINLWPVEGSPDYCLIMIPLLIESGMQQYVDRVLVVDCQPGQQINRVVERDRCDIQQVEQIINSQLPRQKRLSYADDIIDNSGDLQHIKVQIRNLHNKYRALNNNLKNVP